jgi:hypothetical protein
MTNELKFLQRKLKMAYENRQEAFKYFTYKNSRKKLEKDSCGNLQNLYSNNVFYMWRQ